jgi:hypothetical protein
MTDPVLAADGHTYDRATMLDWFARRGAVSMATGGPMPDGSTVLVPNKVVRDLIARFFCLPPYNPKIHPLLSSCLVPVKSAWRGGAWPCLDGSFSLFPAGLRLFH